MPNRLRILLAEDEEADFLSAERAAKNARFPNLLSRVPDGLEAERYLAGEGRYSDRVEFPEPHVVVLDLKMPNKTGFEVLQWLRKHERYFAIPVIIMSTSSRKAEIERAYAMGANTYFVKPLELAGFAQLYEAMLVYWRNAITPYSDPARLHG